MSNLVYGFHSVSPIIWQDPATIRVLYIADKRQDRRMQELIALAQEKQIDCQVVSQNQLDKLCGNSKHQGVAAELTSTLAQHNLSFKALVAKLAEVDAATIMVLDGVTDPHNLGAIIRSCECFGVAAVILPKDNSASVNATVAKVAAGALKHVPVVVVNNLARSLDELKESGFWIAGTTLAPQSVDLFKFTPTSKMVWVMGSEGQGIRRLVAESCDYLVSIPMVGTTQSLNVSVAAGVVLSYSHYCQQPR
jgi:23S rRNA (guanosine2251-2'-O)-methyltransferase